MLNRIPLLLAGLALLFACERAGDAPAPPVAPTTKAAAAPEASPAPAAATPSTTEASGPTEVDMVAAMEAHYTSAILAHDALLQGDLDAFRARMAEFDSQELPAGSPETWKPFDTQLRMAAGRADDASDVDSASDAMAAVALACGTCHQNVVGGPVYPTPPVQPSDQPNRAEMRKHEWAVLLLWNGVTGPSDYAWTRGAEGLAALKIFGESQAGGATPPEFLAREESLRDLGKQATLAESLPARAELYARMLATCGDCHDAVGVKVPPSVTPQQ